MTSSPQRLISNLRQRIVRRGPKGCAFYVLWLLATGSQAGSFQVAPVRATLSTAQPVAALTVRNDGTEATVVQLELMSWAQRDGQDVYTATREILATPPIFTVPAGASQVVRIGLRRPPDGQRELSYRVYMQEVPPPPQPGFQGLQVALRIGIPIFVQPPVAARPLLTWRATRTAQGQLKLGLTNTGNAHVQVANFKLTLNRNQALATQQAAAYVLPGQSREWILESTVPSGAALHVAAQTDAGDMSADVVVDAP